MTEAASVEAELGYVVDTGIKPVVSSSGPGARLRQRLGNYETHRVKVWDGRPRAGKLSIDREGFELVGHSTAVTDFHDDEQISSIYDPEMERLVAAVSGARRVVVFDHTRRSADPGEQEAMHLREPVSVVHNDYTQWSGPERLRRALPEEAEALLGSRFAIIQVWRATHEPIESWPLAVCDARTVRFQDYLPTERRHLDRVGEIYQLMFHPDQRWSYFPRMHRDEALVFKVYDSATDGRARFTAHGSFADPTARAAAPPRRSIEVRTLAFF